MKIKLLGLCGALLFTAANTYAETSEGKIQAEEKSERLVQHEKVFFERNCFAGRFATYETYINFLYKKNIKMVLLTKR